MTTRSNSTLRGVSPSRAFCLLTVLLLATQVFAVKQFLIPPTYPTQIPGDTDAVHALGDFNGDGKLDILVVAPKFFFALPTTISFLPGHGDGTFGKAIVTTLPLGLYVGYSTLAVGDFNGDGKLDVAGIDANGNIALLLGHGDGTFSSQTTNTHVPDLVGVLAVADLNRDRKLDLIFCGAADPSNTSVSVQGLLGNGDGTFVPQTPTVFPLPSGGNAACLLTTGDFNSDGKPDLAVADTFGRNVCLLLGNGDGTFQPASTVVSGLSGFPGLVAGDFNDDGKLDLADEGFLFLGNGDGTFQPPQSTSINYIPTLVGDFNGDGKADVYGNLAFSQDLGGVDCVSLSKGDGSFQPPICFVQTSSSSIATTAMAADLNGDGKLDIVQISSVPGYQPSPFFVSALLGFGDGTFPAPQVIPGLSNATSIASGDFNHDGYPDLVVTTCTGKNCATPALSVLMGNANGTFQPPYSLAGYTGGASKVIVQDFNGDGKQDLLTLDLDTTNSHGPATLQVFLGQGNGKFRLPVNTSLPGATENPVVADFNQDGRMDVAFFGVNYGNSLSLVVLPGNGKGGFGSPILTPTPLHNLVVGDFNGDGKPDLAGSDGAFTNTVHILTGNGDGTFTEASTLPGKASVQSLVAGDFNGDGKLDLAKSHGLVEFFYGNGDGTFQVGPASPGVSIAQFIADDFNGDGLLDVAGPDSSPTYGGSLSLGLNSGKGSFQREVFPGALDPGYSYIGTPVASGDFNHDGALDVAMLISHIDPTSQGQFVSDIAIYLNTGAVAVSLASSLNPSKLAQAVTFKASVLPTLRGVTSKPTGRVTFKDGTVVLGAGTLTGGAATFSTATLSRGQHSITATYSGDGNFIPKTSLALVQIVQ